MLLESAALLTSASALTLAYAARGKSASIFESSIWHGPRDAPTCALTFDDGPSESTPRLLDILERHAVKATFFVIGANTLRMPEIGREIVARGHEIANHSSRHEPLWLRSPKFIDAQVFGAQRVIEDVTGKRPRWFRAPFGVRWFGLGKALRNEGLTGAMWTTIGRDWVEASAGVEARLKTGLAPGALFCLHDGRELQPDPDITNTLEAVERFVPYALAAGYQFKTLSQWT